MTTFANHGRSAGRLGQVVKCSRISLAVRLLPQPQPQGIATPGGRPPACLAFRSAWRAFCSLSDLLETCIRSRMGLSRLHCFSASESLKRPIPIQLGRAIGTRPGIAAMGATLARGDVAALSVQHDASWRAGTGEQSLRRQAIARLGHWGKVTRTRVSPTCVTVPIPLPTASGLDGVTVT